MALNPEQKVVSELNNKIAMWFWISQFATWLRWVLGVAGVTLSTIAASNVIKTEQSGIYALWAAVCLSIIAFVNPQKEAAKYIRAYRMLEPAIREYQYSSLELQELLEIHKKAEDLLNDGQQITSPSGNTTSTATSTGAGTNATTTTNGNSKKPSLEPSTSTESTTEENPK